jgi:hypothetical protein
VVESSKDFRLPSPVEGLDVGLEAALAWGREDRDDRELEAEPDDPSEGVGFDSRALEDGVVVELGVAWQTGLRPVLDELFARESRGDSRGGPTGAESSVEADAVEDSDVGATEIRADDQIDDGVEAVEFDASLGEVEQEPSGWRRGSADASASVEEAVTCEDAANGSDRRERVGVLSDQLGVDSGSAELAERAVSQKVLAEVDDALLDVGRDPAWRARRPGGLVIKLDVAEALTVSACDPALDGAESDAETSRDRAQ